MDFENDFPNGYLNRPFFAQLTRYAYNESQLDRMVLKLVRSPYGVKYTARISRNLLFNESNKHGPEKLQLAPFVFVINRFIVVCYVNYLVVFAQHKKYIIKLAPHLNITKTKWKTWVDRNNSFEYTRTG